MLRARGNTVSAEPLLPLLTEEEIEVLRLNFAYHSPVTGGGVVSYVDSLELDTREALRLHERLYDRQESDLRFLIKMHGGKV